MEISTAELPSEFDSSRTFHIAAGTVSDAEGLLIELWNSGIRPTRAWQPLDDRCNDPLGPRFTVELAVEDLRIHDFGFEGGVGRLQCSTRLIAYVVTNDGS
jgi:hypothetical protein